MQQLCTPAYQLLPTHPYPPQLLQQCSWHGPLPHGMGRASSLLSRMSAVPSTLRLP